MLQINPEQRITVRLMLFTFIIAIGTIGLISHIVTAQTTVSETPTAITTTTQKVAEVEQQVQSNNTQLDATTLTTAGAIGLGGIALGREYLNTKKLKKADDATDRDYGLSLMYIYRLVQTMDAFIPEVKLCLDQPFNSDPMQRDVTIRKKLAEDAQSTANYLMLNLNTAVPSMTPAASVIAADAGIQTPTNKPTQPMQQQTQATSTTTTTPPTPQQTAGVAK